MPVDDANRVKVTKGQCELRQIELDIVLREHDLLGEPGEEVTPAKKVKNQIQFTLSLKIKILASLLILRRYEVYLECILEPHYE